jgi:hypothetical protein
VFVPTGPVFSLTASGAGACGRETKLERGVRDLSVSISGTDQAGVSKPATCAARAAAGPGYLTASGEFDAPEGSLGASASADAQANFYFLIDTPADFAGRFIDVGVRAALSARLSAIGTKSDTDPSTSATVNGTISATLNVTSSGPGATRTDSDNARVSEQAASNGVNPAVIDETLAETLTAAVSIDPSVSYLTVQLRLLASTGGGAGATRSSMGAFDASRTFSFARDAFTLPDGFSITNADASIVDGRWVDPRASAPDPVPLPASALLLLGGLGALGAMRARRG